MSEDEYFDHLRFTSIDKSLDSFESKIQCINANLKALAKEIENTNYYIRNIEYTFLGIKSLRANDLDSTTDTESPA